MATEPSSNPAIEIRGTIRIRSATAAQWMAANPVLATGEPGLETDTRKVKYGDGTTSWNNLPYAADSSVKVCRFLATATTDVTLLASDEIIVVAGQKNVTLPACANGKMLYIFKQDASSMALRAAAGDTVHYGASTAQSQSVAATGLVILIYEGTQKKWCMSLIANPPRY